MRELGVNRCDITIRVKYILGHRLEVIDKRQVNFGVSEVRCGIGYHGAVCIEVEDRAYEGTLEDRKRALRQSKRYLEQFMGR